METIANTAQAEAWNGDEGEHWASHADRYDHAVAGYHRALLDAARISAGEAVLDIGCGCGQSTIDAGRAADTGKAVGIDLSKPMLRTATERSQAAGIMNVTFVPGDAQVHAFDQSSFDFVISRFGAMFFADLGAALLNIAPWRAPGQSRRSAVRTTFRHPQDLAYLPDNAVDSVWPGHDRKLREFLRIGVSACAATYCWRHVTTRPGDADIRWHAEHHLEVVTDTSVA
jgi:SAM-dependent methyltransferase